MNLTVVHISGSLPLHDLEQVAGQQEELLGPLVDLGNASTETELTFNLEAPPPTEPLILRLVIGGQTPSVAGFELTCQGNCRVSGQLVGVAALRAGSANAGATTVAAAPAIKSPISATVSSALEHALLAELPTALSFRSLMTLSANAHLLPTALVAGVGSQESGWGTSPLMLPNGPGGTGDRAPRNPRPPLRPGSMPTDGQGRGFGRGLMQIDWDAHEFARTGIWRDAQANIEFGCRIIADDRDRFKSKKKMSDADALRAAIASYNAGFKGASDAIAARGLDGATGPGTYASRVLPRIGFYAKHGF